MYLSNNVLNEKDIERQDIEQGYFIYLYEGENNFFERDFGKQSTITLIS